MFGKGNCAEFGNGIHTETRVGGRVLHPTDPAVSPGGSSGGDAVAVAAGIVDFAVGGDYGGSVRWPAQCVGVYGLRTECRPGAAHRPDAQRRWNAVAPVIGPPAPLGLLSRVEAVGLFASSAEMIARVLQVIAGPDGDDWSGLSVPQPPNHRRRRIAVTTGQEAEAGERRSRLEALHKTRAAASRAGYARSSMPRGCSPMHSRSYNALRDDLDVTDDLRELLLGPRHRFGLPRNA